MPEDPVTVRIDSYSVALGAFASLDPARTPSQNVQIILTAAPDQGVKSVFLFFKDDAPPGLGWRTPQKTVVVAFLPPAAFADAYRVLQAEAPIFIEFTTNEQRDLTAFHLKTDHEPIGEGPVNAGGGPTRG
jgi:hypothetical protein